jgi:hypothetical protein
MKKLLLLAICFLFVSCSTTNYEQKSKRLKQADLTIIVNLDNHTQHQSGSNGSHWFICKDSDGNVYGVKMKGSIILSLKKLNQLKPTE